MITIILKAATPLGFGQPDFYVEKRKIKPGYESIKRAMIEFALKNNIDLSTIDVKVIES